MCKQDISSTTQPMPELTPEHRLEAEVLHHQQAGYTILQNVVPSNLLVKRLNQEDHSIAHQVRAPNSSTGLRIIHPSDLPEPTDSHWKW